MARYPAAAWKPIGTKTTDAKWMTPTAVVDHSDAGYVISLQGWWLNYAPQPVGSGSYSCHFHIAWDGRVEQHVDTDRRAIANVAANYFGISIECSNSPSYRGPADFAGDAYSPAQIRSLIALHDWSATTHPTIPRKPCTDSVHGFGWHDKFASWTTRGHVCPGATRIRQLQTIVYPATFHTTPEEPDMTPAQAKQLANATRDAAHGASEASSAALSAAGANRKAQIALSWIVRDGFTAGIVAIYKSRLGRDPEPGAPAAWRDAATIQTWEELDRFIAGLPEGKRHAAG